MISGSCLEDQQLTLILPKMTQQYNFTSGDPPSSSDSMPNVSEDFDFTTFLLENRPRVPENLTATDDGWPQRVQGVKRSGNPAPHFGMPDSYSGQGWSPIGTERTGGLADSRTPLYGSSFREPATESNSVFHGATTTTTATPTNPGYDATPLGFVGGNPGLETYLSRIWGSDGTRMRHSTDGSGADLGVAVSEGRDMYQYAWNEWDKSVPAASGSHPASSDVNPKKAATGGVGNTKFTNDDVEDLQASFYSSRHQKDRGESSVSSTSWPSKGNTSAKDGCSNSSKTYSDIMRESRQSGKPSHEATQKKSKIKTKANSCGVNSSASKIPSHYQQSVTPPPGFESSALHVPAGPESEYGLDDFIGTSAKVQRWLQQSQSEASGEVEDEGNVQKIKRPKKKKKSKRPDPLAGSVASFIRDWNSGTSESTDPSSLDDLTKIAAAYSNTRTENRNKGNITRQPEASNVQDIPIKKEENTFFDPRRIFQDASTKTEKRNVESKPSCSSRPTTSTQNFFDPKRIFQSRPVHSRKEDKPAKKDPPFNVTSATGDTAKTSPDYNLYQSGSHGDVRNSVPLHQTEPNHVNRSRFSIPVEDIGTDTTTTTPTTTSSPSSSPIHTGSSLWREHLSGGLSAGDNNNKDPIRNKGSGTSSTPGVQSMQHGGMNGQQSSSGARLDSSPLKHGKSKTPEGFAQTQREFAQAKVKKEEEDMRTRSQARREAEQAAFSQQHHHHFVPGPDGDGIRISSHRFPPHQDYSSTSKPSRHHRAYSNDATETDTKDFPSATGGERLRRNNKSPPQPTSSSSSTSKPRSQHTESQPGWKKNKTLRNQRYESRAGKHGKERKDAPRHHHGNRNESPSGAGDDCNGTARPHHHRHKERGDRSGRNRKDSDGTKSSDTAAHYYDGDQIYQWMKAIVHFATWIVGFVVFLFLVFTAYFFSTCKIWIEYILHILNELWKSISELLGVNNPDRSSRWWTSWLGWFRRNKDGASGDGRQGSDGGEFKNGRGKRQEFVELPSTSSEAIARIMKCDPEDAYAVLGVADNASDDDIKKYYRKQCVMVHPDKCNLRHANDAFQMLQKGYETLTDPVKRYELDRQRCEAEDMLNDIYAKMKEAMNTLNCNMCENKHKRYPVDRPCYAARYCSRHDAFHVAVEGDMWAETTHLGFKWHYYACMDDAVFDITEWAKCQNLRHMESNACEVRYHIGSNNRRRHPGPFRPADEPPPWQQHQQGFEDFRNGDEELDDLLRHLFGDRASRTANDPRTSGHNNSNRSSTNRKRRHRKKKY